MADEGQMAQVRRLQTIWKPVVKTLLYYHSGAKKWRLQPALEFALSSFVLQIVLSLLGNLPLRSSWNPDEARAFFKLPGEQKERVQRLLHLIKPDDDKIRLEDFRKDLLQAAKDGDPLTAFVVEQGLNVHHFSRGENTLMLMRELYDIAMQQKPPNIFAGAMMHGAFTLADNLGRKVDEQALQCYRDMIVQYYDNVEDLLLKGHQGKYVPSNLGGYARLYCRVYQQFYNQVECSVDLLEKYGDQVIQGRNQNLIQSFLSDIKGLIVDPEYLPVGLIALRPIIIHIEKNNFSDETKSKPKSFYISWYRRFIDIVHGKGFPKKEINIQDEIVNLLAQVRVRNPKKLDEFFHKIEVSLNLERLDLRRPVEVKEIEETPGDPLRTHTLTMQLEALRIPALWKELQWAMELVCTSHSLEECAPIMVKKMVNIIYGSKIFDVKNGESQ
ncbi:MAG: hypothetical protein HC875_27000 [Anaerolineales bacterium]|nr:hypothetical protein [Anaerolineales bacterium]